MKSRAYMRAKYVIKANTVMAMVAPMILGASFSSGFDGGGGNGEGAAASDMVGRDQGSEWEAKSIDPGTQCLGLGRRKATWCQIGADRNVDGSREIYPWRRIEPYAARSPKHGKQGKPHFALGSLLVQPQSRLPFCKDRCFQLRVLSRARVE